MEMDFAGMGLEKEVLPKPSIPGAAGKTLEHPVNQPEWQIHVNSLALVRQQGWIGFSLDVDPWEWGFVVGFDLGAGLIPH